MFPWSLLLAIIPYIITGAVSQANSYHIIYVSPNGTDNITCWTRGNLFHCRTITFALGAIHGNQFTENVSFLVEEGNYTLANNTNATEICDVHNVSIIGQSDVNIYCESQAGLAFISSSNITLMNFNLIKCGKLQNITSPVGNSNSYDSTSSYRSGLQFMQCSSINLSNITVIDSNGIGLDIIDTNGDNYIDNSWFVHNLVPDSELGNLPGGGGAAIRLQQDRFGNPIQDSRYTIQNCFFLSNNATSGHYMYKNMIINATTGRYTDFIQGNGGGLGIFLQNNTHDNHIIISGCSSIANGARFGAGLMVKFADFTHNNTVTVDSCHFVLNRGFGETTSPPGNEGGGVRVDFIQNVVTDQNNTVVFDNVNFTKNEAYKGGALSVAFSEVETASDHSRSSLRLTDCKFFFNRAQAGSAMFVSSFVESRMGFLQKVIIEDAIFTNNHIQEWDSISGYGCVYVDKVPIEFSGTKNRFSFNSGSALFVSGADVEIASATTMSFHSNNGHSGGAIALVNKGILTVNKNSTMDFFNNSAEIQGGAIFSFQSGLQENAYSEFCFVRYKNRFVHPKLWNCTFNFTNNTAAKKINAISTPSLLPCVWPQSSNSSIEEDTKAALCWDNWQYGDGNCTEEIETFAAYYRKKVDYYIEAYPGRQFRIPVKFYDDTNLKTLPVLTARISGNQTFVSRYVSNENITLFGEPNNNVELILNTLAPRVIKIHFNVTFRHCPPGFELFPIQDLNSYKCVCSDNYKQTIYCSAQEFSASIRLGYFMTYNSKIGKTFVAPWLVYYNFNFDPNLPGYVLLNDSKLTLNDHTCQHLDRTGYMCETCLPNRSVPLYGYSFQCVECSDKDVEVNWLYYILLELLPVTIIFMVLIIFNISITSGPANGFILFAQVISNPVTVTRIANQLQTIISAKNGYLVDIMKAVLILPYSIWNLEFVSLLPPFCVTRDRNFKVIHAYTTNYITAFYPLFLIIATYVCIKLYDRNFWIIKILWKPFGWCISKINRQWEFQASVVDAFAGFLLLSYSKLCLVSFYLLVPTYAIDSNGHQQTHDARLFFDTSVSYFGNEHRPFFFLALFVIVFVIVLPPVFLFIYPLKIFQQLLNRAGISGTAVRMFVESFQGCYKDGLYFGSHDCRWFASLYFVVRILAFSSIVMSSDLLVQRLMEMVVIVILSVLFQIFRPYKDDYNNKVDVFIFACLLIVVSAGLYNAAVPRSSILVNIILVVGILLPLIYMTCYTGKRVWKYLGSCCKSSPVEYQPRLDPSILVQSERINYLDVVSSSNSFPDRIINPDDYFSDRSMFTKSEVKITTSYGSTH